jgi:hypothetical protein
MSSKPRRGIAEITVLVLLLVAVGGLPEGVQGMEAVEARPVDVPIPTDTEGPFGMSMCLSPDGKRIAVAGNVTDRNYLWNPLSDLFYKRLRYPYGGPLRKTFEKKIYLAPSSPSLSDYSLLVENHRMSAILAMAISPKEPYQLAYVSREIKIEFPADPEKEVPIPPFYVPKSPNDPNRFREVLYVVPLSGGTPEAILTLEENVGGFKRLYDGRYDTSSLCWNDEASALFYGDLASVSHISLSGKRDVLYTFDQKQEQQAEHNHTLASKLACRSGGLVEFLDYGRDVYRHGEVWNQVFSMRLVRVTPDGKVVEKREWSQFPFFNPPLKRNPAILGEETWAYLYTGANESKARLCVGTRSDPSKIVTCLLDLKPGKDRRQFALLGLSPDGSEAWLSQQVDFHDMSDADIARHVPAVPYSSLKRVNVRSIK